MSIFRDRQIKRFSLFIVIYSILLVGAIAWFCQSQITTAKAMFVKHNTAIVSSLLEQGITNEVIATAISNTKVSAGGIELLNFLGIGEKTIENSLPCFSQFQYHSLIKICLVCIILILILSLGIFAFLWVRNRLFQQAKL